MPRPDPEFMQALAEAARQGEPQFAREEAEVFGRALRALRDSGVPHVVGGALAKHAYTGIWRDTKDLDVFLKSDDLKTAMDALAADGFTTEVTFGHWLAKAWREPYFVDLIFGMGHGQMRIDDAWFEHSLPVEVAGVRTRLIPIEELIASKVYIAERHRFDGADVLHLIRSARGRLDWARVLRRLGPDRELLLWHLVLFDFAYPGHADYLPRDLMVQLFDEMRRGWARLRDPRSFRGTLLDPFSFVVDVEDWGYEERRLLEPLVDDEGALT